MHFVLLGQSPRAASRGDMPPPPPPPPPSNLDTVDSPEAGSGFGGLGSGGSGGVDIEGRRARRPRPEQRESGSNFKVSHSVCVLLMPKFFIFVLNCKSI